MKMNRLLGMLPQERIDSLERVPLWHGAERDALGWSGAMLSERTVRQASRLLGRPAQNLLRTMLRHFGPGPAAEEQLLRKAEETTSLSGAECRIGLLELEGAGILFAVQKTWGERLIFQPWECYLLWHRLLLPFRPREAGDVEMLLPACASYLNACASNTGTSNNRISNAGTSNNNTTKNDIPNTVPNTVPNTGTPGNRTMFGRQLADIWSLLARSDTVFTAKGSLPKKTVAAIAGRLALDDAVLREAGVTGPHNGAYPLSVSFALEAGSVIGVIEKRETGIALHADRLERWLRLPNDVREQELLDWVCGLLAYREGEAFGCLPGVLGLEPEKWFVMPELSSAGTEVLAPSERPSTTGIGLFLLLRHLGWLELADADMDGERRTLFRWKRVLPESGHSIIVQPNGELIAEPGCSFISRWELDLVAECVSDDRLAVYRLTERSVAAALDYGRTKQSLLYFLREASGAEVPATVAAMIDEWTSRAGKSGFVEVTLLRCDSVEMASLLERLPGVSDYLLEKLGARDFIVGKQNASALREQLKKAGYPARRSVADAGGSGEAAYPAYAALPDAPSLGEGTPTGDYGVFLYDCLPFVRFGPASPDGAAALCLSSGIKALPAAWFREAALYHGSTRKEMIKRALELQTAVQLTIDGAIRSFVPERLEGRGDEWAVIGKFDAAGLPERSRLTPDLWRDMKLLLPEGLST